MYHLKRIAHCTAHFTLMNASQCEMNSWYRVGMLNKSYVMVHITLILMLSGLDGESI